MLSNAISDLLTFLDHGRTPYHVVEYCLQKLQGAGFEVLHEGSRWNLQPGKSYVVTRSDTTLFAFRCPAEITTSLPLFLVGAHTDSPCLRLKPRANYFKEGYQRLNIEVYGSPLLNTWMDRDLRFGGQLWFRHKGEKVLHTQRIISDIMVRVPSLAIHLQDRSENTPKLNPQTQFLPIMGVGDGDTSLQHYLQSLLEVDTELVQYDLQCFDSQPAALCGLNNEMIASSHLDDLAMVHAGLSALLEVPPATHALNGLFLFHNEEVGSQSYQGAQSNFAKACLERVQTGLGFDREQVLADQSRSLFISADMAHALHPSWEERHDPTHRPRMNQGPVLKSNSNRRYATEPATAARLMQIAHDAGIPLQDFAARNDQSCGSTIGPAIASQLGIPTVDLGNPMLAMHSIRETCGTKDHQSMIRLMAAVFQQVVPL